MQCFQRCVHVQGTLSSHPQPHPPTMISVATQNKWRSIKDVYMCKKLYHPIPNLAPPHPPHFGHRRTTTIVGIYIYIYIFFFGFILETQDLLSCTSFAPKSCSTEELVKVDEKFPSMSPKGTGIVFSSL